MTTPVDEPSKAEEVHTDTKRLPPGQLTKTAGLWSFSLGRGLEVLWLSALGSLAVDQLGDWLAIVSPVTRGLMGVSFVLLTLFAGAAATHHFLGSQSARLKDKKLSLRNLLWRFFATPVSKFDAVLGAGQQAWLLRKGRALSLTFSDPDDAAAIRKAVGQPRDAYHFVWSGFLTNYLFWAVPFGALPFLVTLLEKLPGFGEDSLSPLLSPLAAATVASVLLMELLQGKSHSIQFGSDGVVLRQFYRKRYVSYRELDHARAEAGQLRPFLRLTASDGKVTKVYGPHWLVRLAANLVQEGIESARASQAGESLPIPAGVISVAELKKQLKQQEDQIYRGASVPPERLRAVLSTPAAQPEERVAAAVGLAHRDDRAFLEKAREHLVNPDVQDALDELLEDGEDKRSRSQPHRIRKRYSGDGSTFPADGLYNTGNFILFEQ